MRRFFLRLLAKQFTVMADRSMIKGGLNDGGRDSLNQWFYYQ
jgi:hypothetical protein